MFIEVPGAKLFALRHGDRTAQTIIGVGGWIGNSELWAEPFALLSDRWSTISYDHRGTGASVCDPESISLPTLVEDVFSVMDAFGVERGVLAAESSGALSVLTAALERPERVSHLVIVDGGYDDSGEPDPGYVDALLTDYPGQMADFVRACLPEDDVDHLIEWGMKLVTRSAPEDAVALLGILDGPTVRERLHEITQPTLVIHGERDVIVPIESSEYLAATVPNSEFVRLPDTGHVPTITRPERVADLIAKFLERNHEEGEWS